MIRSFALVTLRFLFFFLALGLVGACEVEDAVEGSDTGYVDEPYSSGLQEDDGWLDEESDGQMLHYSDYLPADLAARIIFGSQGWAWNNDAFYSPALGTCVFCNEGGGPINSSQGGCDFSMQASKCNCIGDDQDEQNATRKGCACVGWVTGTDGSNACDSVTLPTHLP